MNPKMLRTTLLLLTALAAPACIFARVTTPLAYRSPTPSDAGGVEHLGEEVSGRACYHSVLGLVAVGNAGYERALQKAKGQNAQAVLADVRSDVNTMNVLGVYQQICTTVHARVVR